MSKLYKEINLINNLIKSILKVDYDEVIILAFIIGITNYIIDKIIKKNGQHK